MERLASLSRSGALPCWPQLPLVPAGINFFSPFSALDFRLTKDIRLGERWRLSLIGDAFNIFISTNVRGSSKNSYSGRNITIGSDFYNAQSVAGGFFGSGGPRAFQFAARLNSSEQMPSAGPLS